MNLAALARPRLRTWFAAAALVGGLAYATSRGAEPAPPVPVPVTIAMPEEPVVAQVAPRDQPPISIMVVASPVTVGPDEPLPLSFYAVNRTDRPLSVLRSLDASDMGWRYPKIDIEIRDARGQLVEEPGVGRCGLVNPLAASDFVELAPGARVDLVGDGTFGHHRLRGPNRLAPGTYSVTLRYDLRFDQPERATREGFDAKIATLPRGVFTSPPITIEVK